MELTDPSRSTVADLGMKQKCCCLIGFGLNLRGYICLDNVVDGQYVVVVPVREIKPIC